MSFESNIVESDKQDKIIACKDCGEEFIFTIREQDFYAQKGFTNDPTRCVACRAARKQGQPRVTNEVNVTPPRRDNSNSRPPRPSQPNPNYGNAGNSNNYGNPGGNNNRNDNYNNGGNSYGNNNSGNAGGYNNRNDNYANRGARPSYNNNNPGGYNNRSDSYNGGGNSYGNNNSGNRNDNSGNRRENSYGNSGFGQRSNVSNYGQNYQERKLYNIVCSNCGVETQVPFVPRQGVPVFCKSCYNSQKTGRY